jgi:hypothetical protein
MRTKSEVPASLLAIGALAVLAGCQTLGSRAPATASLRTDSAQVVAHHSGFGYGADIGFLYTNTTTKTVSKAGCGGPTPPDLEKKVNDHWVRAYDPIYPSCLTLPGLVLKPGESHHGVLRFMAAEPGHNTYPMLNVASIDGIYRLRWDFGEGVEGVDDLVKDRHRRTVTSVSNEFRMVLAGAPVAGATGPGEVP